MICFAEKRLREVAAESSASASRISFPSVLLEPTIKHFGCYHAITKPLPKTAYPLPKRYQNVTKTLPRGAPDFPGRFFFYTFAPAYPPRTVAPRWCTVKAGAKLHRYGTYTYYPSCCDAGKPANETQTRMVPLVHRYRLGRVYYDSKVP